MESILTFPLPIPNILRQEPRKKPTPLEFAHRPSHKFSFMSQPNVFFDNQVRFETLEYLSQPLFTSERLLNEVLHLSQKAKEADEIPLEKIWMGSYFDRELLEGIHPKTSIRWINEEVGFGVFAEQKISPCSFAGEYTGQLIEANKKDLQEKFHSVRYPIWGMKKQKWVLDAEKMGNFTRFINHSAQPNLKLQSVYWRGLPRMILVALQEIPLGAQLLFDYGPIFWKQHPGKPKSL